MSYCGRRILILSNFFTEGHGGAPESVLLLARQLALLSLQCDVLCNKGLCRDVGVLKRLPRRDERTFDSPKSLILSDYGAVFVAGSWDVRAPVLVLRAVLKGLPITYAAKGCLSGIEFTRLRDLRKIPYLIFIECLLLAVARHIIFSSYVEQESYVVPTWFWRKKAILIPEPFEGMSVAHRAQDTSITLGFMAEISPRKGLLELIEGFGLYLVENPGSNIRLRIVGEARIGSEDYFSQCKSVARRNGSDACIEWCPPVRGDRRAGFYASLDLFVCPSQFESFGLTVLEALWQGTQFALARD